MNVANTVFHHDFPEIDWEDLKLIIQDKQTKIKYLDSSKRFDLAYRYKKTSMIGLFLICVLAIVLPVAEYLYYDNPAILWLIAAGIVFVLINYVVGTHNRFWMLLLICLFDTNSRVVQCTGGNLFIIWALLYFWDGYIERILVNGISKDKESFIFAWLDNIDQINAKNKNYIHIMPVSDIKEEIKKDEKHAEQFEKDKERLEYYNNEFSKRFGMYLNPVTDKPVAGAQDYLEGLLSQKSKTIKKFDTVLTIEELDKAFSEEFSSPDRPIYGMKDYLLAYDRQQEQAVAYQEQEEIGEEKCNDEDPLYEESKGKDYYLRQLDSMVGMAALKKDVRELIDFVQLQKYREENGFKSLPLSLHLVFSGNPGTGKTTVARILANIYREIGVLSKGQLVEVDRADLVAGYVGQTAIKTKEKIEEAMGGVLFIDEAYTLNKEGNDFGQEAIDTILKAMEDNRDKFIVIVAGYPGLMNDFINSNPGLKSRFSKTISFPDYNSDELFEIFIKFCNDYDYILSNDAYPLVKKEIVDMVKNRDYYFANAREVRNFFEKKVSNQAARVMNSEGLTEEEMITIEFADVKR